MFKRRRIKITGGLPVPACKLIPNRWRWPRASEAIYSEGFELHFSVAPPQVWAKDGFSSSAHRVGGLLYYPIQLRRQCFYDSTLMAKILTKCVISAREGPICLRGWDLFILIGKNDIDFSLDFMSFACSSPGCR